MTQPPAPPTLPPSSATNRLPSAPSAPARRGCGSQILSLIGWALTLTLSVALALAAAAAVAYFFFGFTLATPNQIRQASTDLSALQTQVATIESEAARLRSGESESAGTLNDALSRVEELERQVAAYEQQAAALAGQAGTAVALSAELEENIALAATIQAEGREGQVLMAVVATVQTDNAGRLAELQQRTERISRFLQRLGDLAGDAAAFDGTPLPTEATPTVGTPGPSSTQSLPPEITPASLVTATATATPRP